MAVSKLAVYARRFPIVPSMLTYSVLYPSANLVQQYCFRKSTAETGIDWREVSRFCIYGGLFHAPLVFNWLRLAARLFPKDTTSHLLAKVFLDQTCFAPVGLSAFYIGLTAMEGKSVDAIYQEWREKFPNTWAMGAMIWPFIQAANFKFVPAALRTIFVAFCSFFWNIGLSAIKASDHPFLTGVCIWTFLTAINFKLIPARYRPIYVGFCGFFWFTFLAYLKSTNSQWESPVLRLVNHLLAKQGTGGSLEVQKD